MAQGEAAPGSGGDLPDEDLLDEGLPEEMRAAVYRGKGRIEIESKPRPVPGEHQVLLEVSHCGICGTDLHLVLEGWGRPGAVPGHEYSGVVVAVGDAVRGVAPGDRVVGGPVPGCGTCPYCRGGRSSLCTGRREPVGGGGDGAFADFVCVEAERLLPVPENVPLRHAALCEPLAVALHGINLARVGPEERTLVSGAGPIGLLTIAALRAEGRGWIRAVEPSEARRRRALEVGADEAVKPDALRVPPMPFEILDDAVDVVFECSGVAAAVESGLAQLRRAGRMVLVGTGIRRPRLDANRVLLNELQVTGAYEYDDGGLARSLELIASGTLPMEALAEPDDVRLDDLLPAMQDLAAGRIAGKVLVIPG